jgi:hypothetical protein
MGELLVREFMLAGGSYEELYAKHAVKAKPHNGKVSLIYDQLAARDDDPLACQCRGLVLREETWEVVAHPFHRFFNHGQGAAAPIDWATARFEEKLDGTLLIVYWDDRAGRWMCATRSMSEAHGDINGVGTFAELADQAAANLAVGAATLHDLMEGVAADRRVTHLFELTGPYNTIVCRYAELGLTLLGARSLDTGIEIDPAKIADATGFTVAKTWEFSNVEHLMEVIREWDPREHEGVVVKDAAFNRIKVKSPKYLAVAHAGESLGASWRSACEAVASGAVDDITDMLPPLALERVTAVRAALASVIVKVEADFAELRSIDDMKTYALAAQKRAWPAALFSLKRGKAADLAEVVRNSTPDHLLGILRAHGGLEATDV